MLFGRDLSLAWAHAASGPGAARLPRRPDRAAGRRRQERHRPDLRSAAARARAPRSPAATDIVTVHYTGWSSDGRMFDSSVARGNPSTFPLNRVMAGWRECVQLMTVGEKRRCWVPQELAYKGQAGRPDGHGGVRHRAARHAAVADDSAARRGRAARGRQAHRQRAGLQGAAAGHGRAQPRRAARASPCTTRAGRPTARCSTARSCAARPPTLSLDDVIRGWTEGVQLMVEGERTRFWIPAEPGLQGRGRLAQRHAGVRHRADPDRIGTSASTSNRQPAERQPRYRVPAGLQHRPEQRRLGETHEHPQPALRSVQCDAQLLIFSQLRRGSTPRLT